MEIKDAIKWFKKERERLSSYTDKQLVADYGDVFSLLTRSKEFANSGLAQEHATLRLGNGLIAYWLALNSATTGWVTNNKRVLLMRSGVIACCLAFSSYKTGWTTSDPDILELYNNLVQNFLKTYRRI